MSHAKRAIEREMDEMTPTVEQEREELNVSFEKGLSDLINRHCQENASNTPDHLLARYLLGCLAVFNTAVQQRETWYGRDATPMTGGN